MTDDYFLKHTQKFQISSLGKQRILSNLHNATEFEFNTLTKSRRSRSVTNLLAGAAAIVVVAGSFALTKFSSNESSIKNNAITTNQVHAKVKKLSPSDISTLGEITIYKYTGNKFLEAIHQYAIFPIKLPHLPSNFQLTTEEFNEYHSKSQGSSPKQSIQIYAYKELSEMGLHVEEWPVSQLTSTPFDDLVGTGKGDLPSLGKPEEIKIDGTLVKVGWPLSKSSRCYQFIQDGTLYFININWSPLDAKTIAEDNQTSQSFVRSLIHEKSMVKSSGKIGSSHS